MSSLGAGHVNAFLVGAAFGAAYYVAARAMEVAALHLTGRATVGAILGGFMLRLFGALGVLWFLTTIVQLPVGALCLGFLGAYNVVFGREAIQLFRKKVIGVGVHAGPRETMHGRH